MRFTQKRAIRHQSSVASGPTPVPLRGGMTLVELLVVIVLISTLVSTAIPIISPGGEDRKLREASRGINAYFQGAQARAIQTGRPFGVAMRRLSEDTGRGDDNAVVTRLEYVEVPPPYSGFDKSSLARVCVATGNNGVRQLALQFVRHGTDFAVAQDRLPSGYDSDLVPTRFLRPNDEVVVGGTRYVLIPTTFLGSSLFTGGGSRFRTAPVPTEGPGTGYFNTSGPNASANQQLIFEIRPVAEPPRLSGNNEQQEVPSDLCPGVDLRVTHNAAGEPLGSPEALTNTNNAQDTRYFGTTPSPFKVYRQPVPAAGESLELPSGIAIDLQSSVFGNGERLYKPTLSPAYDSSTETFVPISDPAMVLFSPEGNVEKRYLTERNSLDGARVTSTLALCVGRRELIPPERTPTSLALNNTPDGSNVPEGYDEPIDLVADLNGLTEDEAREITDKYNWLNTESRWVVIGAQSGAIRTVETSSVFPSEDTRKFAGQLQAALDNVQSGSKAGGR